MNGPDMEEIPFQKVKKSKKARRKKCCRYCCCSSSPGPPPQPPPPPPAAGSSGGASGAAAAGAGGGGGGGGGPPPLPLLDAVACEDQFDCKELESLFQNYNLKLEQTSTLKALAVLIVLTASLALVELLSGPSLTISKGSHPVHCIIFLSLFIVTNVKYLQVTQLQQIVKLTLLFSFTFAFLCCPFSLGTYGMEPPSAPEQGMWQLMLVTFVSYALLPVRTLLAIVFGLVVAISHLIVAAASVSARRQPLWRTDSAQQLQSQEAREQLAQKHQSQEEGKRHSAQKTQSQDACKNRENCLCKMLWEQSLFSMKEVEAGAVSSSKSAPPCASGRDMKPTDGKRSSHSPHHKQKEKRKHVGSSESLVPKRPKTDKTDKPEHRHKKSSKGP
ncbi:Adenylate cyclase type 1 [Varanus komodoensis]|nr:Adenylate cyclase type 1 [Varanus komodoensis]